MRGVLLLLLLLVVLCLAEAMLTASLFWGIVLISRSIAIGYGIVPKGRGCCFE
jgi:hypothetical protein